MPVVRFRSPPGLLAALLLAGGLLAACTSNSAPDAASADSTAAPTTTTVSQSPPPNPSAPTDLEQRADDRSVAEKLADTSLETKVKRALVRTSALRIFPFRPTVIDGHLILRGDVNTPDQYRMAQRVAGRVDGIDGFTNRLTMGGRPVTPQRLDADAATEESEDTAVYHTVQSGDTLWDIARKYGASVQQIRNLNDFRSTNLRPGQRIRVR
jgi:nucleoid-associated protein YgaU